MVGITALEVGCEKLQMCTLNSKATKKIAKQKVIANEPTRSKAKS